MAEGDTWLNAFVGAVVTIVFSFLPVSPAFGGGVAAYLQGGSRRDGASVGALSGGIAAIPLAFLFAFVGMFVLGFGLTLDAGVSFLVIVPLLLFVIVVSVAYSAALGAIGGYLAVYLDEEDVL